MKTELLVVERMVLESILTKERNYFEICDDTGLYPVIVKNLLDSFILKGHVIYQNGRFSINKHHPNIVALIKSKDQNISDSLKDMFVGFINSYFKKEHPDLTLKFQKLQMSEEEAALFDTLFLRMNNLVDEIKKKKRNTQTKIPLKSHRIIFWGSGNYQSFVQGTIPAWP